MTSPSKKNVIYCKIVRTFGIIGLSFNYITLVVAITREDVSTAPTPQIKSTKVVSHRAGGVADQHCNANYFEKLMPINVEKTITI